MLLEIEEMIKEINNNYTLINKSIVEIKNASDNLNLLIKETDEKQTILINSKKNRIEQLKQLSNNTSDILYSDNFNNNNTSNILDGFEIKKLLKLKPIEVDKFFHNDMIAKNNIKNKAELIFFFKNPISINKLDFYIENKKGIHIHPVDILYSDNEIETSIIETFDRFFYRSSDDIVREYIFYPKQKINYIKFVFDFELDNININSNIVNFYLEKYNNLNNVILKYDTYNKENITLRFNYFDILKTLNLFYSFDSVNYTQIELNEFNSFMIENKEHNKDVFIKIKQDMSLIKKENNEVKQSFKKIIKYDTELGNEIKLSSSYVDNVSIFFTFLSNKKISLINNNIIQKNIDSSYTINNNFFKKVSDISDEDKFFLDYLDSSEVLEEINKPIFIFETESSTLYIPKFFELEELNFRIEFEESIFFENNNDNTYSPFIFNLDLEV